MEGSTEHLITDIKLPMAVVTGATSGIGEAFAKKLAKENFNLLLTGRKKEKLEALSNELTNEYKIIVQSVLVELSNDEELSALINTITENNVDVLVNNAGFGIDKLFYEDEIQSQENMVKVHIVASLKLIHAIIPRMIKKKKGIIINVSSIGAFLPSRKNAVYGATKSFLKNFTEALHLEVADKGIKVQALCPGFTKTEFQNKLKMKEEDWKKIKNVKWMLPKQVVDYSWKQLEKNKVVCIPGLRYKLLILFSRLIPRAIYYRLIKTYH